jgi:Zn-dependent M28 family amino/carboxypeptidase
LISELKQSAIKVSTQNFTLTVNTTNIINIIKDGKKSNKKDKKDKKDSGSESRNLQLTNVIAEFGSSFNSDGHGKETLLLGAHWDTRPFSDRDSDPKKRSLPILGANDGASGVAVLLELAKIMGQNPPDIRVIIALFDGEDYGEDERMMFLGSKYFAKNMGSWKPDYGVVIDMVGDKKLSLPMEETSLLAAPSLVKELWKRAERLGLRAFQAKVGPAILDDHVPLINSGVACIDIIDLDYPYWHTTEDTVDKCSPESLEAVGKLLVDYIYDR